jgi:hypothetical protein
MNDDEFQRERRKQRRLELIGTAKPRCPDCAEADWCCFEATSVPRCANCHIKATVDPNNAQHKQRRLRKLGTSDPCCAMCGENDWRCIEEHHPAGRKHDPIKVLLCANDHLRMTDEQKSHPSASIETDAFLLQLSNFLRGLADMLRLIVERLIYFADALLELSRTDNTATQRTTS